MSIDGTTKTAVFYLRVSGQDQIDGDGFPRQIAACMKFSEANSILVYHEFRDEGVSGKTELENRQGLSECLAFVERNKIDAVIVESADRLARDSLVSEIIIREFQKIGVKVYSASGSVDLTAGDELNPTAKLIRQILGAIAEFDRCVTVNKLRAARERVKAKNGRCEGVRPFGQLPGEDDALGLIKSLDASGASFKEIAAILNRRVVRTRSGGDWIPSTVRKIVSRERTAAKFASGSQSEVAS